MTQPAKNDAAPRGQDRSATRLAAPPKWRRLIAIARARPILFDHLPKCGGTTIADYLKWHYLPRRVFNIDGTAPSQDVERFGSLPSAERTRFRLILGHQARSLVPLSRSDAIRFTILREPVDRIISHYYYVLRVPAHPLHARVAGGGMSLREYVESGVTDEVQDYYTSHFAGGASGVDEALTALQNLYTVVGTLEELPATISQLRTAARLWLRFPGRRRNVTGDRPPVHEIDRRTRLAIESANENDLQLYAAVARGELR